MENKYQQIGWYGAYTKESQNFCTEYDFEYDLDQIDTLIKFNDTDSVSVISASDAQLKCGGGVVLYSHEGRPLDDEYFFYGFLDNSDVKLVRTPTSYFESFEIINATNEYEQVKGVYKLTDIFKEKRTVYKNLENGWYIFSQNGRFRLADSLENYTDSLIGQRDKPNGIFASETSDTQYAVSIGVEEISNKLCEVNSRYLIRQSTGARFEKAKKLYIKPRTPRSIDEQIVTETSKKENPTFMEISNFQISPANELYVKYKSKIKEQSILNNTLTLKYDAIASEECSISTPVYEEYENDGFIVEGLLGIYDAGYTVSQKTIDEPIQKKTIRIANPPSIVNQNDLKVFDFDKADKNLIIIDDSVGTNHLGGTNSFTIFVRYKSRFRNTINRTILSKWEKTGGFVDPESSFILNGNSFFLNSDNSTIGFTEYVNRDDWNNIAITFDYQNNKLLKININGNIIPREEYPLMTKGEKPFIIGGVFEDTNVFEGFDGQINDVRIYNRSLTDNEVSYLFESTDYDSKQKKYELPLVYAPASAIKKEKEIKNETHLISNKNTLILESTDVGFSEDLTKMISAEKTFTFDGKVGLSIKYFEKNEISGQYVFKFDKYILGYDRFVYEQDLIILQNNNKLASFIVTDKEFKQIFTIGMRSSDNFNTKVTKVGTGRFIICAKDTTSANVFLVPSVINESATNITPRTIRFKLNEDITIKNLFVLNDLCIITGTQNKVFLMKLRLTSNINNSEWLVNNTFNFSNETDIENCNLVELNKEIYLVKYRKNSAIGNIDSKYKTCNTFKYHVGHLELVKLETDNGIVVPTSNNFYIVPPYSELGEEFLEHENFGDTIKTNNNLIVVSNPTAFENDNSTPNGICYFYEMNDNKNGVNFISRIFTTSDRRRFGKKIFLDETNVIIQHEPNKNRNAGEDIIYASQFFFNFADANFENKQEKYEHEQYDEYFKMIAWYRFNNVYAEKITNSNAKKFALIDHSGNYNHLTCYFANNIFDNDFIGPTEGDLTYTFDKFSHGTIKLLDFNDNSFSINIWYLVEDFKSETESILMSMFDFINVNSDKGFILYSNGDFKTGTLTNTLPQELSLVTETNQWNMLTLVYNKDLQQIKFYVNSKEKKSIQNTELIFENNMLSIGGITYTKFPFHGSFDDIKIYKKVLTKDDIEYEYQKSWKFQWIKT